MELLLIKTPYEINFSGNPVAFSFAITPYRSAEQQLNLTIIVRTEIEEVFGSNIFIEAKESVYSPLKDGSLTTPLQTVLRSYLTQYIPPLAQALAINITGQVKRFRITYRLLNDNVLVNGSVNTSDIFYVIKGGMSFQEWHPNKYFTQVIVNDKPFLRFAAKREKVFASENKYLSWLYPYDDDLDQNIYYNIGFNDGTELGETLFATLPSVKWQLNITPAGFDQLALGPLVPVDKYAVWYSVSVKNTNDVVICNAQKFYLDYRQFYKTSDLLFTSSIGGIETVRLRGIIDAQTEYERINADRVTAPEYFSHGIIDTANENIFNAELEKFTGDTGFLPLDALDRLRDLVNNKNVFEIKNNRLVPVNIVSKNDKWYTNKQSLYSHIVEWQNAFKNEYYSPAGTINTGVCPAVEKLQVRQTGSDKLTIAWALETGYDKIEIVIDNGTTRETFIALGNHGQVERLFVNPAPAGGTANVSVEAKTICNDLVDPADKGPKTTIVILVSANVAPIANDDYYSLVRGYTTDVILKGSVLANDYDANGDPVAVIPNSGATLKGGTYNIDAAGIITYRPPSGAFTGVDNFIYTVTETSGATPLTALAVVYITVGSGITGPTGIVYVKQTVRNSQTILLSLFSRQDNGEVWLEYYSDAAGTQPLDVTGLGLTVNVDNEIQIEHVSDVTTHLVINAVGIDQRIYTGWLFRDLRRDGQHVHDFVYYFLKPGVGYQVI
jgi:hypothetical protein